jgi:peptidoglycan/LPS O-acetylase OafA/YrhL
VAQVAVTADAMEDRKIARGIWIVDVLRWVSALAVVLGHVRNDIFVDYEQAPNPGAMLKLFYFATGFGHQAVIVFFVLSGYLVGGEFWLRHPASVSRRAVLDYLVHRFSRIYIVLVPALLLTWAFDGAGQAWFGASHFYDRAGWSSSLDFVVSGRSDAGTFFCNLANLQQALCSPFGSDAPLWSLSYEWFYYLSFPLLLVVALRVVGRRELSSAAIYAIHAGVAGALSVLAMLILPVLAAFIAAYPIWLFGVAARIAVTRHVMPRMVTVLAVLVALTALAAGRLNYGDAQANDYLLGLAAAVILADIRIIRSRGWLGGASERLAGFSYSLYAIHLPIVLFALAMLRAAGALPTRLPPGPIAWSYLVSIMLAVYASAWVFARGTEAQTGRMRRVISGWLEANRLARPSR